MQRNCGKRNWFFPDGEMPLPGNYEIKAHESIIILNSTDKDADIEITLYFTDRDPIKGINVKVGANRVRCLRTNNLDDMGGVEIPLETQYAIGLKSNVPVIAQYGRLEAREQPMAFYTNTGYWE